MSLRQLVINREFWLTGKVLQFNPGSSCLLARISRQRCCLGFYAQKLGLTDSKIENRDNLTPFGVKKAAWLEETIDEGDADKYKFSRYSLVEAVLTEINDSDNLRRDVKERRIAYFFKKYGKIDVIFAGDVKAGIRRAKAARKEYDKTEREAEERDYYD